MLQKDMEPPLLLNCAKCKKEFSKVAREVRRQRKKGRTQFYCSRFCGISAGNVKTPRGTTAHLDPKNQLDEFSPFRYYLRKARGRKKHQMDLDLKYLKKTWESQKGRCLLSGVQMEIPSSTTTHQARSYDPLKPSLDRIDSSKGYLKGNVRFVTTIANYAKQSSTDEEFVIFCRTVVAYHDALDKDS